MNPSLSILHLEDNEGDAVLVETILERNGVSCEIERVENRAGFLAALDRGGFDLILSDYSLPGFDGLEALALAREKRPDIPFLFVSGMLGEDLATQALKSGATDYILKERMSRLAPAVRRALADAHERLALQRAEEAMVQSEHKYRMLFDCLSEAALLADAVGGRVVDTNRQAEILFGRPRSAIVGSNVDRLLSPETLAEYRRRFATSAGTGERVVFEGEILAHEGHAVPVSLSATPVLLHGRRLVLGLFRDVTDRKQAEAEILRLRAELSTRQ